jgi:dTDP-glucose 4,6-dehydratase
MRPHDGRAIPTFVPQALKNLPITIFGNGSQTRSFCYVSDLVEGIYKLLMFDINDPINIGNPHEMTIKQMAEIVLKVTGSNSELVYKPLPEDDPKVRQPDISRAKKLLGWEPEVGLEQGLMKTVEWFKTQEL